MFKEEKIALILLLMALGSIGIIHWTLNPPPTPYSEDLEEGTKVSVEGRIVGSRGTWTGDHAILHVDNGRGLVKVFVPGGKEYTGEWKEGADVLIIGRMDTYKGEKEVVANPEDIQVKQ